MLNDIICISPHSGLGVQLGQLQGERVADGLGDPHLPERLLPGLGGLHIHRSQGHRVRCHVDTKLPDGGGVIPGEKLRKKWFGLWKGKQISFAVLAFQPKGETT